MILLRFPCPLQGTATYPSYSPRSTQDSLAARLHSLPARPVVRFLLTRPGQPPMPRSGPGPAAQDSQTKIKYCESFAPHDHSLGPRPLKEPAGQRRDEDLSFSAPRSGGGQRELSRAGAAPAVYHRTACLPAAEALPQRHDGFVCPRAPEPCTTTNRSPIRPMIALRSPVPCHGKNKLQHNTLRREERVVFVLLIPLHLGGG